MPKSVTMPNHFAGQPVIFIDGQCRFCRAAARWARRAGVQISYRHLQEVDLASVGIDPQRATELMAGITHTGAVTYGLDSWLLAARSGPTLLRAGAGIFALPGCRRVGQRVYALIADNRYRLGCSEACGLPPRHPAAS